MQNTKCSYSLTFTFGSKILIWRCDFPAVTMCPITAPLILHLGLEFGNKKKYCGKLQNTIENIISNVRTVSLTQIVWLIEASC